jgi:hypothetical protein
VLDAQQQARFVQPILTAARNAGGEGQVADTADAPDMRQGSHVQENHGQRDEGEVK